MFMSSTAGGTPLSADRVLALSAPRRLVFEPVAPRPLLPTEVRIRTLFSGISAGTELTIYRGQSPYLHRAYDPATRLFTTGAPAWEWPVRNLGYEEVGEIVELGCEATAPGSGLAEGDRVFGTWGHRTSHVMAAADARARLLPAGADPRIGIFSHIGAVALNGVHDARIRLGDTVVVFGLGVPGQIVAQAARAAGAAVIGVDPLAHRRDAALRLGAARVLDPTAGPVAELLRRETGGLGADVCIEVSGVPAALAEAMRTVAYASRVVAMGFMPGEARGLMLGEEFHHNRVEVISSQISGVAPEAAHRWTRLRLWQTAVRLQAEGRLNLLALITDTLPFAESPAMFARLDGGDPAVLQAVLDFGAGE